MLTINDGPFGDEWFEVEEAGGDGPQTQTTFCDGHANEYPAADMWKVVDGGKCSTITDGQSSWIEEWMDMNGIFDPSNDVICSDIDLPDCQSISFDDVTPDRNFESSKTMTPSRAAQADQFGAQPSFCPADDIRGEKSAAEIPYACGVGANDVLNSQEAVAVGDDRAVNSKVGEKKSNGKIFVLRPIPKEAVRLISSLSPAEQHPRPVKVIKASYTVDSGMNRNASSLDRNERAINVGIAKGIVNRSMNRNCGGSSPYISEKKREQNRSAAIRYRVKRREEAKRKKEELHELELRNVALKTQVSGLSREIGYLRDVLHEIFDS
ncbi:unnamed protein product [Toxocara canis]|uniref:BZIP domain-containing protein n=1 Tax=Toxocara canis TaxID=6265 RepID=A0A183UGT6_TOXCA|nr:unnamed protein product [Toxocara canis]